VRVAGRRLRAARKPPKLAFRDSKLTMLLADSLGGTSSAVMIACCSPAVEACTETLRTLQFAMSVKRVKNRSVPMVDPQAGRCTRARPASSRTYPVWRAGKTCI
jgi:hypothetical protein